MEYLKLARIVFATIAGSCLGFWLGLKSVLKDIKRKGII